MRYKTAGFFLMLIVAVAGICRGDDNDAARELFKEGGAQYEGGNFEEALAAFQGAFELRPNWKLQYNIGQCHAILKQYGMAIEAFEKYLGEGGDDVRQGRRDEVLAEARRLRDMVGAIGIAGTDGLIVLIDGIPRGETPLLTPIRVAAGRKHTIKVMDGEAEVYSKEIIVGSAQTAKVEVPSRGVEDPDVDEPAASKEPSAEEGPAVEAEVAVDKKKLRPPMFWVGLGATMAFGAGTVVMNAVATNKIDDIKKDPDNGALRDSGKTLQVVGITLLALTAAAGVATGILAGLTEFGAESVGDDGITATAAPWVSPQGGGVAFEGSF